MINKQNGRTHWIDVAKGWGIVCVILGHLQYLGEIRQEVYSFHIPLFFFLSGVVFNAYRYEWRDFFKHKIMTMLVPYFSLGLLLILFLGGVYYYSRGQFCDEIYALPVALLEQIRFTTLWFLSCLFVLELFFYGIVRGLKDRILPIGLSVIAILIVGLFYYSHGGSGLPWNIDVCTTGGFFFFCGYMFHNRPEIVTQLCRYKLFVVPGFISVNVFCNHLSILLSGQGMEMFAGTYGVPPLSFIAALAGIFVVTILSGEFDIAWVRYVGKHSLVYFVLHQSIVIPIVDKLLLRLHLFENPEMLIERISYLLVCTCLVLVVLTVIDYILRHTRFNVLLGRSLSGYKQMI